VPDGGNWKRAIDRINVERRRPTGPAVTLYNKAIYGKEILEMIAAYTPAAFEDLNEFSKFISKVDAFITTQSILQRPKFPQQDLEADEEKKDDEASGDEMPKLTPYPQAKAPNAAATADEWDF
jgi:hypothetical protein